MKSNQVKLDSSTRSKTLKALLNIDLGNPSPVDSFLIKRCKQLNIKPIGQFSVEDLRIMIGQHIGIDYLIPLALEVLEQNILAEGNFYPGDLLISVVRTNREYWLKNPNLHKILSMLIQLNDKVIEREKIDVKYFVNLI